eukprot:TRINITY_DN8201_c0_g1_i1.p1 TRINITY_DN8201_c0_g1~~TRINITY_DN8201_c0_g1_i1.p1  ORF type:complete len:333 (-),score=41.17 TRINITY_DN8201_c0_g1_i1:4-1002(-)
MIQLLAENKETLYGFFAVTGSIIAYGSFGVPIKTPAIQKADVHPWIYMNYKSTAVFIVSWLILSYNKFTFTYWGFISASIFVSGGTMAIAAIRYTGLGVSQAIWSGTGMVVSFLWGWIVLKENVKNIYLSFLALFLLCSGIAGVALSPNTNDMIEPTKGEYERINQNEIDTDHNVIHRKKRFKIGILLAFANGFLNGSFLVPLSYAPKEAHGIQFLISFAIGIMVIVLFMDLVVFIVLFFMGKKFPPFHFRVTCIPGLSTGFMWTIGNFCATYATLYLGNTIGFPLVQVQLIISGMWGLFYYKEIKGWKRISLFFGSVIVTIGGAILLSLFG